MNALAQILTNKVLLSSCIGWFLAQGMKVVIELIQGGVSLKRLTGSGGMPSSHSATVTGLVVASAQIDGLGSSGFAYALLLAFIVIYDARGVRYQTGLQSQLFNRLRQRDIEQGQEPLVDKKMEEKMGHTMPEILAGILIGALTAICICNLVP